MKSADHKTVAGNSKFKFSHSMAIGASSWELDSKSRAEESKKKNRLKKIQRVVMFLGSFGFLMIMASPVKMI